MSVDPNSPEWKVQRYEGYEFLDIAGMNDECLFALVKTKKSDSQFSLELWYTRSIDAEWARDLIEAKWSNHQFQFHPCLACGHGTVAVQFQNESIPWLKHRPVSAFE
jgi:hypothetical protein